jgi:hypothetical protein
MDNQQFILELVRIITSLGWPAALVTVAYIAKLVLDKTDIKDTDGPDPRSPIPIPRVQVRPAGSANANAAPPSR